MVTINAKEVLHAPYHCSRYPDVPAIPNRNGNRKHSRK